jgi:KDO2-lipid IV(A) lauroyltransferase
MYYLFVLGKFITLLLPRRLAYFLARILAILRFYFFKRDREIVTYNLSAIINDKKELEKNAKECFINFSYYLVDFFRYSRLNSEFLDKYVRIERLELLNQLIAEKKGIIFLTAHLGNYELGGAVTALLGYPLNVVALPHKDKRTNQFFDAQRELVGLKVIPAGMAVKKCFSLLKNGGMIAFLADRDFSGHGIKTEMFAHYTCLPRGAAFFALKTGACILPTFFVREDKLFYRLIFDDPIFVDKNNSTEEQIIKQYIPILEKYIRKYSNQWYLFERYWLDNT